MNMKNYVNFITKLNSTQKFGLRKLSIGLTTVVLGTTFLLLANPVQAAENDNSQNTNNENALVNNVNSDTASMLQASSGAINIKSKTTSAQNQNPNIKQVLEKNPVQDKQIQKDSKTSTRQTTPFSIAIGPNSPQYLMANNDTGSIQVNFKGDKDSYLFKNGDSFSISVDNSNNFLKFSPNLPTFDGSMSNFKTSNNDSNYTFTYQGQTPFNLQEGSVTLNFVGNNDTVLKYDKEHNITDSKQFVTVNPIVTVAFPHQQVYSKQIEVSLYPYANVIDRKEIVNGYPWQGKVVFTPKDPNGFVENNVTYTGPEDSAKADIPENEQQDARLMQYIINWNYGRGFESPVVDPLDNVIADLKFNDGQKILPHTIKVFKITDPSLIGTLNKTTSQINRRALDNETYAKITASSNEDPNFEKFLQDRINNEQSQISINQTGPFTVNGQDYSRKGAYFIQLDTLLDVKDNLNKWVKPGAGPSISYPQKNSADLTGSGNNTYTQTYLGFNTASGSGDEVKENIVVKYVDDDAQEKLLDSDSFTNGTPNRSSNYSTKDKIIRFEDQGYLLVKDPTNGDILHFDEDNDPDNQVYIVHLKHDHTKETISKTIHELIHYYYNDDQGHHTTQKVFDDYTNQVNFSRVKDTNLATGEIKYSKWAPATANFSEVKSPIKNGFTYDKDKITAQKISSTDKDLVFIVYYSAIPVDPLVPIIPVAPVLPLTPQTGSETDDDDTHYPAPHPNNEPTQTQTTIINKKQSSNNKSVSPINSVIKQKGSNLSDFPKVHSANEFQQTTHFHKNAKNELPQTSNNNLVSNLISIAGLLITGLGISFINSKKKN